VKDGRPSYSAERVAMFRAAHQLYDAPLAFEDPLALPILGPDAARYLERARPFAQHGPLAGLRAWLVARSRFAEDELGEARGRGIRQYVILGAGLDTFAYRQPAGGAPLDVFEVDHPATQEWKRLRLGEGAIPVPGSVHFVPTDFEGDGLGASLRAVGFRPDEPAFLSWLGVSMYLTRPAIGTTLDFLASTAAGSEVVLDYFDQDAPGVVDRVATALIDQRAALSGEPFRSRFHRGELARELEARGFHGVRDLGADEVNARYFADRSDGLKVVSQVGRLLTASR
jgi:methyltransferase (TIGR00027 family)